MSTPSIPGFEGFREIGRGGFGVVYRAFQPDLDRPVAIKVLLADMDAKSKSRFQREAVAMGRLSGHPYILPIYSVGFAETGEAFLVLPFLSGGSLGERLRDGPIPESLTANVGVKMAAALDFAHQRELVHRDVKPDNILFNDFDEPVLADFGIATVVGMEETASGVVTASVLHAAPEVLDGHRPTPLSDQYSLASTIYEAVAGHAAFHSPDDASLAPLLVRIMTTPPPDLQEKGVSEELCEILERAMAKVPEERFPAMVDFASALRTITDVPQEPIRLDGSREGVTLVGVPAPPDAPSRDAAAPSRSDLPRRSGKRIAVAATASTLVAAAFAFGVVPGVDPLRERWRVPAGDEAPVESNQEGQGEAESLADAELQELLRELEGQTAEETEDGAAPAGVGRCEPAPPPRGAGEEKPTFDEPAQVLEDGLDYRAVITTSCGEVVVDLDEERAPETVNSFVFLAREGFFDGLEIFRNATSISVLQTGAGNNNAGWQVGYTLADELEAAEDEGYPPGSVAMANSGPDSAGSQFFFVYGDFGLEPTWAKFGQTVEGLDVLRSIGAIEVDGERPLDTVYIESVTIQTE